MDDAEMTIRALKKINLADKLCTWKDGNKPCIFIWQG